MVELMPGCTWPEDGVRTFSEVWCTSWGSKAVWRAWKLKTASRRLVVNKSSHVRWWYRLPFHEIVLEKITSEYWSRYFWRVLGGASDESFRSPQLRQPPPAWRHQEQPNKKFVLINPTAAWPEKYWSAAQWGELIAYLKAYVPEINVLIAGGGAVAERQHCARIVQEGGGGMLNLAGRTSLMEYLHLLASASLVVCIDGAASHLAQAFGVSTVTIFGPTHDNRWHWPTPNHIALAARRFTPSQKFGPASKVPVGMVWEAVSSLLRIE
jgi:ADP-heptose:LPS heptosyltransferase